MDLVRIVGGGVAGLALAAHTTGVDVEVIDAPAPPASVATAFALWPRTVRIMRSLGVLDDLESRGVWLRRGRIRDARGRTLADFSPPQEALMVPRTAVVAALRNALPPSVRLRAGTVDSPQAAAQGAAVLVGADGVHSPVRAEWWGTPARHHGLTVLRGVVPGEWHGGRATETWGSGWLFGITPVAEGQTNWFACLPRIDADTQGALDRLGSIVGGISPDIDAVLGQGGPRRP